MSVSQAELDLLLASLTPSAPKHAGADGACPDYGSRLDPCPPGCASGLCVVNRRPPSSTISDLRGILVDFEANSARSTQLAPGPSELAVACDRRLAYRTLSTPERPDGRVKWAPMIGTAVHALIADALHADNQATMKAGAESARWLVEERVWPDQSISGSCDAYDTQNDMVVDWKVVGPSSLTKYRRHGPGPQYEGQIQLYGRGWQAAGKTPRWVRIVFLARSHDYEQAWEWTAPYSAAAAEAVLDRLYRLIALTTDLKLADNPSLWAAVPANPGDDCRFCPYLQRGIPAATNVGCPGDVAADERRTERFTDGLIA